MGKKRANNQKTENKRRQPLSLKMVTMETVPICCSSVEVACFCVAATCCLHSSLLSWRDHLDVIESWQLLTSDSSLGVYNLCY